MKRDLVFLLLACLALSFTCRAEEEKIPPGITEYKGRKIAQTMHYTGAPWLTRESREREEECSKLLKALKVKPGDVICDMGCGNGFYSLQLAKMTGDTGKVIGVDIQQEMLSLLQKRAAAADIKNIELVLGNEANPKLKDGTVDLMFMVDVYHEFDHPVEMMQAIRKSLKPDGRLVQVEFRSEDKNVPIKTEHKMSKAQVLKEILPFGFKLIEEYDGLPWQHVMFFARDDSKLEPVKKENQQK